jgi:hypothetical protein
VQLENTVTELMGQLAAPAEDTLPQIVAAFARVRLILTNSPYVNFPDVTTDEVRFECTRLVVPIVEAVVREEASPVYKDNVCSVGFALLAELAQDVDPDTRFALVRCVELKDRLFNMLPSAPSSGDALRLMATILTRANLTGTPWAGNMVSAQRDALLDRLVVTMNRSVVTTMNQTTDLALATTAAKLASALSSHKEWRSPMQSCPGLLDALHATLISSVKRDASGQLHVGAREVSEPHTDAAGHAAVALVNIATDTRHAVSSSTASKLCLTANLIASCLRCERAKTRERMLFALLQLARCPVCAPRLVQDPFVLRMLLNLAHWHSAYAGEAWEQDAWGEGQAERHEVMLRLCLDVLITLNRTVPGQLHGPLSGHTFGVEAVARSLVILFESNVLADTSLRRLRPFARVADLKTAGVEQLKLLSCVAESASAGSIQYLVSDRPTLRRIATALKGSCTKEQGRLAILDMLKEVTSRLPVNRNFVDVVKALSNLLPSRNKRMKENVCFHTILVLDNMARASCSDGWDVLAALTHAGVFRRAATVWNQLPDPGSSDWTEQQRLLRCKVVSLVSHMAHSRSQACLQLRQYNSRSSETGERAIPFAAV